MLSSEKGSRLCFSAATHTVNDKQPLSITGILNQTLLHEFKNIVTFEEEWADTWYRVRPTRPYVHLR
jgi:hypothetical protein